MKNIVMAMAICLLSASAFASEEYASGAQLPAGSSVEALFDANANRMTCPPPSHVAKKYCWDKKRHWFKHCGYFCAVTPKPTPPHGKN